MVDTNRDGSCTFFFDASAKGKTVSQIPGQSMQFPSRGHHFQHLPGSIELAKIDVTFDYLSGTDQLP
jgi:hypothetical protein